MIAFKVLNRATSPAKQFASIYLHVRKRLIAVFCKEEGLPLAMCPLLGPRDNIQVVRNFHHQLLPQTTYCKAFTQ